MTNTLKKIAIAAIAAATMVAGVQTSNASGMNALASIKSETAIAKVGFFKKGGKFTNRGVAAIGLGAAVVGGLLAKKAIKHRNERRARRYYAPRRTYVRRTYKPRRVVKRRSAPRKTYRPAIAFNQNVFNQQTWLNQLGYNAGLADGKMGPNTRTAASQFQLANGMPATGYLTAPQTGLLAQQAAMALAQRTNPYAVRTVAAPKFVQPVAPAAPAAFAPQVRYAPAPATQVIAQPRVQQVAPQVQYAPAAPAPQVQQVAPAPAQVAPVKPIAYAPQGYQVAPQVQYAPAVRY